MRLIRLVPVLAALSASVVSLVPAAATKSCSDSAVPLTVQENRLTATLPSAGSPVGPALATAGGFDPVVARSVRRLCFTRSLTSARTVVTEMGTRLWQYAADRAQGRGPDRGTLDRADDRPLYWARLQLTRAIRQWRPTFPLDTAARSELLTSFDRGSRGITSVRLPAGSVRRILISGFDPFGFDAGDLRSSNPSGSVALELDGRTISTPDGPAVVEAVTFPVVYRDFDDGIAEAAFGPALGDPARRPDVLMTISAGGGFSIERWAAAWRDGVGEDNDNAVMRGPVPPASGWPQPDPQFIETTLPYERMLAAPTGPSPVRLNNFYAFWPDSGHPGEGDWLFRDDGTPPNPGETAALGGGGAFLSNESQYRANRLRLGLGAADVAGGHLHTPSIEAPSGDTLTDDGFEEHVRAAVAQTVALIRS